MVPELVRYLEDLSIHLRLSPLRERQLIREVYTHLEDRVQDLTAEGVPMDDAVERATQGFGRPEAVAREMHQVHSIGTWAEALLAASPYAGVFLLFGLHLWQSLAWLAVFMGVSVGVTLIGWWRGKPPWMYPWAGYSLVLPLVSGIIATASVAKAGLALVSGDPLALPVWVLLGLLVYIPFALWMVVSVMIKVIRLDWIFASLMFLPFPILVRWMLSLQFEGNALSYSRPGFEAGADLTIALVFLSLALLPIIFVRVRQRRFKIGALLFAAPVSLVVAAFNTPGDIGLASLLLFPVLAVLFLLTPALLDAKIGRGSGKVRADRSRWPQAVLSEPS